MAEKKVISDFEAQIRQLIADHRRLTALCKETAAERDVLRKENRDLQMQVKELGKELATALLPLVQSGRGFGDKDGSTAGLLGKITALRG